MPHAHKSDAIIMTSLTRHEYHGVRHRHLTTSFSFAVLTTNMEIVRTSEKECVRHCNLFIQQFIHLNSRLLRDAFEL